jgi:hypothetical protein
MKKLLLATAALVAALNVTVASAVEVEYYGGTAEFAKLVGKCYDQAPPALLTWIGNPKVITVKDYATFIKLDGVIGVRSGYLKKYINPNLAGLSTYGDPSGAARTLTLLENRHTTKDNKFVEAYTCSVVYHEIMHLYDFRYGGNGKAEKSADLKQAFKADVAQANAFYKKASKELKKDIDDNFRYFMSAFDEAFAESGAVIVYFHPESFRYNAMTVLFPQMMERVRALLVRDEIIKADHVGMQGKPEAAPIPADVPSGKVMSELRQ